MPVARVRAKGKTTSSIDLERQIESAIARWVDEGLVEQSDWTGRPLLHTKLPSGPGIHFDEAAVVRVLKFCLLLKQLVGRWAGHPFRLLDWQVRWLVAPVFGIKNADGRRVIRTVWFEIPRKNGKTTLCAAILLYLFAADREHAAEVYCAARDKLQARLVFQPARRMALASSAIRRKLGAGGIRKSYLEHPETGAIFRPLSSDGDAQHGLNVHGAGIDEVHVHKNPDTVDALETGTGAREQPLIVFITTADEGKDGSIYATKREYLEGIVAGRIDDASFFGVVFGADQAAEGFDPFSEATLRNANPGYGVTVMADYLERKANEAKSSPAQLNRYLRLHLNVRTKQTIAWLLLDRWDVTAGIVDPRKDFKGKIAWIGLDLSATSDFTAAAFIARTLAGYVCWPFFWIPEERVDDLERQCNVPLRRWVNEGWVIATEGNVVDYAKVRADIKAAIKVMGCTIDEIAYDPWNATETVQLLEQDGFNMVPIRQGYASLSSPSKELERVVLGSSAELQMFLHGGHPVLRWMADVVEAMQDPAGNIKPSKPDRRKSAKRIDGIAATVNGLSRAMVVEEEQGEAYFM